MTSKHKGHYAVALPFPANKKTNKGKGVVEIAEELLERISNAKKHRTVHPILFRLGSKDERFRLKSVEWMDDSVLYITCHGNRNVIGPFGWQPEEFDGTPEELANILKEEMPKEVKHLKIMTCHSGVGYGKGRSYASKVCKLISSEFPKIIVYGYMGFTGELEKGKKTHSYISAKKDGKMYQASLGRVAVTGVDARIISGPEKSRFKEEIKKSIWNHGVIVTANSEQELPMGAARVDVDTDIT